MNDNPDTTTINELADNIQRELNNGDTPTEIANNRSLTTTQLAHTLNKHGHHQMADRIRGNG